MDNVGSSQRTGEEITALYHRHADTVWRVCFSFMKNTPDTEDMVQETFLQLIRSGQRFDSEEHEKAWLIVVASNLCRDALKRSHRRAVPREDGIPAPEMALSPLTEAVLALPEAWKTAVYLHYYEGYSAKEIAALLHCPHATVRTRLMQARRQLKTMLGGDCHELT